MSLTKVSYSLITGSPANVLDFGADPTGTADSAAAIQSAIDSGAKAIYLPAGTYKISAPLNFSQKRSIHVYGDAAGSYNPDPGTKIIADGALAQMFNIYSCRDSLFENIVLDGNSTAVKGIYIWAVNGDGNTTRMIFSNINVLRCTTGIQIGDGTVNQTSEISFYDVLTQQCTTGVFHAGDNTTDIGWFASGFSATTTGYNIRGGGSVQFYGCNFITDNGGESILIVSAVGTNTPGPQVVPRAVDLFGCLTETPGFFISTENSPVAITGYPNVTQITLSGCRIWKPTNTASIRLRTSFPAHLNIASCTFDGANASTLVSLASPTVQTADLYGCTYMDAQVQPAPTDSLRVYGQKISSYVPTWTGSVSNPVLGNGSIVTSYKVVENRCFVTIQLTLGSTTTLGSGVWAFSLPYTAANSGTTYQGSITANAESKYWTGTALVGSWNGNYTTVTAVVGTNGVTFGKLTASGPGTWASGDQFFLSFDYDIA